MLVVGINKIDLKKLIRLGQAFGDSLTLCHMVIKCVRKWGTYQNNIHPNLRSKTTKYVNYGEYHAANYKGCSMQKIYLTNRTQTVDCQALTTH